MTFAAKVFTAINEEKIKNKNKIEQNYFMT